MTVNVDPDLGAILSLLEYRMKRRGFTQAAVQKELDWKGSYISQLLNRTKALRVEQLLQILVVIDINPVDFIIEAYGRQLPKKPEDEREEMRLELVRLLYENLEVYGERSQGTRGRCPELERYLEADLDELCEVTEKALSATRDLAAAAQWMLPRFSTADRRVLVGLAERLGSFELSIAAIDDFLAVAGSPEGAAWAMEHENLLLAEQWTEVEDVAEDANLKAILFLLDLDIRARASRRLDIERFVQLRDRLQAIQEGEAGAG